MGFSYGVAAHYGDGYTLGVYEDGFALYKNGAYVIDGTKIKNEGLMTIHFDKLPIELPTVKTAVRGAHEYQLMSKSKILEDRVKALEDILAAHRHLYIDTSSRTLEDRVEALFKR